MEGPVLRTFVALLVTLALMCDPCSAGPPRGRGPPRTCTDTLDVAIVGGGIAGAYSAYRLRNEFLKIRLFEYSDRLGGRFFTTQLPNVPDQNLELGGMRFINGIHVHFIDLIKELGLQTRVLLNHGDGTYESRVFRRNVSLTSKEFSTGDIPYNLTAEEKANQPNLLRYFFTKLTGESMANMTEERLYNLTVPDGRKLYELSTPEAISLVASPEAQRYLLDQNHFNSDEVSATDMLFYYFGSHGQVYTGDDVLTVTEGFSRVVEKAVEDFLAVSREHSLEKNRRLVSITNEDDGYRLFFKKTVTVDGGTRDLHGWRSREIVCAKKVILALPKFALGKIDWPPLRTRHYEDLMFGTFLAHASKVFMTYDRPWWLEDAQYPARILEASGLGEVYDWGQSNATGKHTLLVSYNKLFATDEQWVANNGLDEDLLDSSIGGLVDPAETMPILVEDAPHLPPIPGSAPGANQVTAPLKDFLYARLGRAFGMQACTIPAPRSAVAQFWIKYPFGGGWAFTRPGYRYEELVSGYRRPSDRDDVFVVGTDYATRDLFGWAEGALFTVDSMVNEFFPGCDP